MKFQKLRELPFGFLDLGFRETDQIWQILFIF